MRAFVAYFEGIDDGIPSKEGRPTKAQWDKFRARVAAMHEALARLPASNGSNGHHHHVSSAVPAEPGVDPVPGGTTVNAKWMASLRSALEEIGYDGESINDLFRDERFRVDLNTMPADYARRIEAGSY